MPEDGRRRQGENVRPPSDTGSAPMGRQVSSASANYEQHETGTLSLSLGEFPGLIGHDAGVRRRSPAHERRLVAEEIRQTFREYDHRPGLAHRTWPDCAVRSGCDRGSDRSMQGGDSVSALVLRNWVSPMMLVWMAGQHIIEESGHVDLAPNSVVCRGQSRELCGHRCSTS